MKVTVNNCLDNQIKLYDQYGFYYCESPICNDDCPILNKTATCVKGNNTYINKKSLNKCVCENGWIGKNCETRDFIIYNK